MVRLKVREAPFFPRVTLMAKISLVFLCSAKITLPKLPLPKTFKNLKSLGEGLTSLVLEKRVRDLEVDAGCEVGGGDRGDVAGITVGLLDFAAAALVASLSSSLVRVLAEPVGENGGGTELDG